MIPFYPLRFFSHFSHSPRFYPLHPLSQIPPPTSPPPVLDIPPSLTPPLFPCSPRFLSDSAYRMIYFLFGLSMSVFLDLSMTVLHPLEFRFAFLSSPSDLGPLSERYFLSNYRSTIISTSYRVQTSNDILFTMSSSHSSRNQLCAEVISFRTHYVLRISACLRLSSWENATAILFRNRQNVTNARFPFFYLFQ